MKTDSAFPDNLGDDAGLGALLHPASAFRHPRDVVARRDLALDQKRALLAAWASDGCAIEAAPALRRVPGSARPVPVDEILEALQELDRPKRRRPRHRGAQGWRKAERRWTGISPPRPAKDAGGFGFHLPR